MALPGIPVFRNEVRFVLVDVCGWMACNDPTSCRCSNDVRANGDGVYRIREVVTDEDCGLNNSWSILRLHTLSLNFYSLNIVTLSVPIAIAFTNALIAFNPPASWQLKIHFASL